eukprot:10335215-Alexandrium_andersonii.AAC.1
MHGTHNTFRVPNCASAPCVHHYEPSTFQTHHDINILNPAALRFDMNSCEMIFWCSARAF